MKSLLTLLVVAAFSIQGALGQNSLSAKEMIAIRPVVCKAVELPENAKKTLNMKLLQMVTANGLGSTSWRYALTPNVVVMDQQSSATVPVMHSVELEVSIYLVDIFEGVVIDETSIEVKGLDRSPSRTYIEAIKSINPRSPQFKVFMDGCRTAILDYYTTRIPTLLTKAESLADRHEYEQALQTLAYIPESVDEYPMVARSMVAIHKKMLDRDAKTALINADKEIAKGDYESALDYIVLVDPSSNKWGDANDKIAQIKKLAKEQSLELLLSDVEQSRQSAETLAQGSSAESSARNAGQSLAQGEGASSPDTLFSDSVETWFNKNLK